MYLRTSSSYNSNYYYAVEFMLNTYETKWVKASKVSSTDTRYNYFELSKPENATSLKVAYFANSVTTMSEDNATAIMSKYDSVNNYYDVAKISNNGSTISISGWTSYQTSQPGGGHGGPGGPGGPGGMHEGNSEKADYSAKGIKADNEIIISAGKFFIKSYDDAIHANYGDAFENGATGIGNITLSGGDFEIYASDDGIHADDTLTISSNAVIDIVKSYEGIEGNIINITGGYTKVYSTDDGLNAANKAGKTPAINISGGVTDITVYGQDVDGIDSNGSFTQMGGYVITKGANGGMSTGLDCDGTAKINGGTFVSFGKTEKTPTKGSGVTNYTLSGSYSTGSYKVTFGDGKEVTTTTKYSYSAIYVYSDISSKITVLKNN
ncbi:MAG: carbohydrate-binding domain-containing protein [Bacilli bacterium]|nr:carbohydrate-binding domain-containing protein [Bacilli bacterium]